ncbi:putative F-box protein At3g16210 [Apium graveolens]|uniref:putative F-box protein At3g16210 n=1 Tax=Apium graveolens TaxID=4045 RepID=UPI003D7A9406
MTTPTTGNYIPEHLLTEILIRLPVKSLLLCKSVSKPWLSLISNPNFIKSHIKHTTTKPGADQTLIVKGEDDYSLSLLNLNSPHIRAPLDLPFSRGYYSYGPLLKLVGSCNGIICVSVYIFPIDSFRYEFNYYLKNPMTYLWNPATKQSKLIPVHSLRYRLTSVAIGFGFDPIENDYKVVRIVSFSDDRPRSAEVYSANHNVWRRVRPFGDLEEYRDRDITFCVPEDYPEFDEYDICVNGLLSCSGLHGIMAFDLNKEVFTCRIPVPVGSFNHYHLTDFNDSIAVITRKENEGNHVFKLWTLDDEACLRSGVGCNVKASWTLILSIDVDYSEPSVYGCFNSGDFLLYAQEGGCLLYNSHKKEARFSPVSITIGRQIIKYNESLVSVTGSKQVEGKAHEDDS